MNIKEAYKKIETALEQIQSNEEWQNYLSFHSRFHNYSFGNSMLIYAQRPDATYVAGYTAWLRMGRFVKKGEKAIKIFAPVKYKKEDGEENDYYITGFKLASVFDISQTDGDDDKLPVLVTGLQTGHDEHKAIYNKLCSVIGLPIIDKDDIAGKGEYHRDTQQIFIKTSNTPTQKIKTLLHEYAHHLYFTKHYAENSRSDEELIAESVAYIACSYLGIDTGDYSFSYLASWSNEDPKRLRALASKTILIANEIIAKINTSEILAIPEPSLV